MGGRWAATICGRSLRWVFRHSSSSVCVAIYAVLVQGISAGGDIGTALWTCIGYTVLLCFTLFKTSSVAKSVFNAR